jgi:choice-of-anchor C domain-containing protein
MTLRTRWVLPATLFVVTATPGYSVGQKGKSAVTPEKPRSSLVVNGSFERRTEGEPNAGIESLGAKDKVLLGWQVIESKRPSDGKDGEAPGISNVDWIGPERWTASHGKHCLDLDGGIRQVVRTKVGQRYVLEFDMAGNPEVGVTGQRLRVTVGRETHEFDFDASGKTERKMGWLTKRVTFTVDEDQTALIFLNTQPNGYSAGVALDNVVLRAIDDAGPPKR